MVLFLTPWGRDPSLPGPGMKEDMAMAVGPDLPGPEQETDGEADHVPKHTALPAFLRLSWLGGAQGSQAQAKEPGAVAEGTVDTALGGALGSMKGVWTQSQGRGWLPTAQ